MAIKQVFQNSSTGAVASGNSENRPNNTKNNKQPLEGGFGKTIDPNSQNVRGRTTIGSGGGDVNSQKVRNSMAFKNKGAPNDQMIRNPGKSLGKGISDVNKQDTSKESNTIGKGGGDVNSQKVRGSRSIN